MRKSGKTGDPHYWKETNQPRQLNVIKTYSWGHKYPSSGLPLHTQSLTSHTLPSQVCTFVAMNFLCFPASILLLKSFSRGDKTWSLLFWVGSCLGHPSEPPVIGSVLYNGVPPELMGKPYPSMCWYQH